MLKRIAIIFLAMACSVLAACRVRENYAFLDSVDEISEISIVSISFDENNEVVQTKIRKIEDTEAFLNDFKAVDCYTYFGDPTGVVVKGKEDTVIKVSYQNGEYELINWRGQAEDTLEKDFSFYAGFSVFDEEQFEALIEKYTH